MAKLSEKQRTEAKELLDDYQKICDLLHDVTRTKFLVYIINNDDEHDVAEVHVRRSAAKSLLESEKTWTEAELKKLGIEVA